MAQRSSRFQLGRRVGGEENKRWAMIWWYNEVRGIRCTRAYGGCSLSPEEDTIVGATMNWWLALILNGDGVEFDDVTVGRHEVNASSLVRFYAHKMMSQCVAVTMVSYGGYWDVALFRWNNILRTFAKETDRSGILSTV